MAWPRALEARVAEARTFELAPIDEIGAVVSQLALARQGVTLIAAALGALGLAAFICDGLGLVRAVTPVGEEAVAGGRLRLVNGRLSAPARHDGGQIDAAIAAAAADRPAGTPFAHTIVSRDPHDPASLLLVDVIALPRQTPRSTFEPRAVVVLRGGGRNLLGLGPILTQAFGLTRAEAEVASRLAAGDRREMIAADRGASLQTVRSQIKSIFAKLNVTRERDMVSLIVRLTQR